jgi:hypothetical protein
MFLDGLDDFIAMSRFLAEQQQDDQLQVSRREHLRRAHPRATPTEPAAEGAPEEAASAATAEVPAAVSFGAKMIHMSKHGESSYSLENISHDISKVKKFVNRLPKVAWPPKRLFPPDLQDCGRMGYAISRTMLTGPKNGSLSQSRPAGTRAERVFELLHRFRDQLRNIGVGAGDQ